MLKKLFVLSLILVFGFSFSSKEKSKIQSENIIVLVIDGPRYTETWGDSTHAHIPNMYSQLLPQGVLYQDFRNTGFTITNGGHTAICTGVDQNIDNTGKEIPQFPSVFQYYIKEKKVDSTKAWVITSKDKLEILANCKDSLWHNKYRPAANCGLSGNPSTYRKDKVTMNHVYEVMKKHQPNLMIINLKEPDFSGHAANWKGYLKGIEAGDKYALELWNTIQNDAHYKGKTTLFITSDHGRHLDGVKNGYINHGCDCEGCRQINLLALGPDFKQNKIFTHQRNQKDIASTIAYMLSFQMATSKGEVMMEMFK